MNNLRVMCNRKQFKYVSNKILMGRKKSMMIEILPKLLYWDTRIYFYCLVLVCILALEGCLSSEHFSHNLSSEARSVYATQQTNTCSK